MWVYINNSLNTLKNIFCNYFRKIMNGTEHKQFIQNTSRVTFFSTLNTEKNLYWNLCQFIICQYGAIWGEIFSTGISFFNGTKGLERSDGSHLVLVGYIRSPQTLWHRRNFQNTNICCELIWAGFHYFGMREYSESLLWDLGVTQLIIIGGPIPSYKIEEARPNSYLHHCLVPLFFLTLTCSCFNWIKQ
jgi:hypothetical protein